MSKNIIMFAVIGLLFLGGMGAGFYVLWTKISSIEAAAHASTTESAEGEEIDVPLPVFKLPTLIVNLSDKGGRRYLRLTMDVELESADIKPKVEERLPQVKDAILRVASIRKFDDINSVEGKDLLRDEIISKINELLKSETSVTNLYFTEFVVQ